jgi:hypothetical protein
MMDDKLGPINPIIESAPPRVFGGRFLVKGSTFDNGVDKPSIMLIINDLVEKNFRIKFYKDAESAASTLRLLEAAK